MADDTLSLTEDEIAAGWHWCNEFDGLLVGPGCGELHACSCLPDGHPAYATAPPQMTVEKLDELFANIEPMTLPICPNCGEKLQIPHRCSAPANVRLPKEFK